MKNANKLISDSNLQIASDYILQQFDRHSWWPKAQPGLAKQEFNLMHGSSEALNVWCTRWLDSGQLRKLTKEIQNKAG